MEGVFVWRGKRKEYDQLHPHFFYIVAGLILWPA